MKFLLSVLALCVLSLIGVSGSDIKLPLNRAQLLTNYHPAAVKGDPVLRGFFGEEYNVHGVPDEYFNLITAPNMQINSLFTFIGQDDADKGVAKTADSGEWHAPGTYITELGFRLGSVHKVKVVVQSSGVNANDRRLAVQVNDRDVTDFIPVGRAIGINAANRVTSLANARAVAMTTQRRNTFTFSRQQDGSIRITTPLLQIDIVRSGLHMNMNTQLREETVAALNAGDAGVDRRLSNMHGLLGQMYNRGKTEEAKARAAANKRDGILPLLDDSSLLDGKVDDYLVSDGVFGTQFTYNKFKALDNTPKAEEALTV